MEFTENEIAKIVFESGLQIHKTLGPGLLESAYEECLYFDLVNAGLGVEKQKSLPLIYKEIKSIEALKSLSAAVSGITFTLLPVFINPWFSP